jgi:hypothetical protein
MSKRWWLLLALGACAHGLAVGAPAAEDTSTPGEIQQEPATLHCLAVRWPVKGDELDFRLKADGPAIDKGVLLPNFNDGFQGKAPDLGALELGEPMPQFGPRPAK